MKKKHILLKEFLKEIKVSRNRFISILLIVFLGVAFFAGIRAAGPDMRISADAYYDDSSMMDVRVMGTLGLTDEDVTAISEVPGVENVVPHYSTDVFFNTTDSQLILHAMSLSEKANRINVKEGRLPKEADECLVDENFLSKAKGYKIGDTITVNAEEENLDDLLTRDTYTIVGVGSSPYYLSLERGSSSIGTGEVSGYVMLLPESFAISAYTEITASVAGAKELTCYTEQYDNLVEDTLDNVEALEDEQCEKRFDSLKTEGDDKIADAEEEIKDARDELADAKTELDDGEKKIADAWEEIRTKEGDIRKAEATIADKQQEIGNGWQQYNDGYAQYESGYSEWANSKGALNDSEAELNSANEQLGAAWDTWYTQGQPQLDDLYGQLAQVEQGLQMPELPDEQRAELEATLQALTGGIAQLEGQKNQIAEQQSAYDSGRAQLDAGWGSYYSAKSQLDSSSATLKSSRKQLVEGEAALRDAKHELADGKTKLEDAKTELTEKEQELADGKKEYEEESKKAEKEISDAEDKILDAKDELADLEVPSWHVLDRNSVETYVSYGQDADRIEAIGNVFPLIFFLVAALICLTTMTRMVEENRTQIGTLKALGYTNVGIAMKYLWYAFFATFLGGMAGLVVGQKFLPVVIIQAYGILYNNLPDIIAPIHGSYSVTSMAVAIGCTLLATLVACYRETTSTPAALMRPESPKSGKRIVLERIGFIWKRLNFSNKATFRNLFRYKKRFFMTILGIGGCMGLILVGFGLKDSISAIGTLQYGKVCIYDGILNLDDDRSGSEEKELLEKLDTDKNITEYLLQHTNSTEVTFDGVKKTSYLIVPQDAGKVNQFIHFQNRLTQEVYELEDEGVFITEKLAKLLEVEEGDTIQIKDGDTDQVEARVSHIVENYFNHYIYISPTLYKELFGEEASYDNMFIRLKDTSGSAENTLRKDIMKMSAISGVDFITKVAQRVDDMLESMNSIIYVLVISAGLLAFVVLYNLNNINISERKRELATLKVLGFYDQEVSQYVFRENIWLTLFGCVLGVGFGLLLHRFLIVTAEIDVMMFGRNIEFISFAYSIGLTFLFSLLVNATTHFKLKKIDMVQSLKSVE